MVREISPLDQVNYQWDYRYVDFLDFADYSSGGCGDYLAQRLTNENEFDMKRFSTL